MKKIEEKEIAFIGKITASVTHEIKNVFASIREISGLMEDLLSMAQGDSFPFKEKFQSTIPRIGAQIERGSILITQLNKFSHLADSAVSAVDLNEITEHLVFLTQRFARLKNVTLQNYPSDHSLVVTTNPLLLQMNLHDCIQYVLARISSTCEISVRPMRTDNNYSIEVGCTGAGSRPDAIFSENPSDDLSEIKKGMVSLEGRIEMDEAASCIRLILPPI